MEAAGATLEYCDELVSEAATKEDIAQVLARTPRPPDDWYVTLTHPNGDYMDVSVKEDGTFQVQCDATRLQRSASVIDEALLNSLLASFLEDGDSWTRECKWVDLPPPKPAGASGLPKAAWLGIGLAIVVIALYFLRLREWIVVLFAAAFPGLVAFAIVSKMREVKRASTWTKGSAHIVRSEQVSEERKQADGSMKPMTLPAIEYEYSVGFNKFRGDRVSIGEVTPNSPQVQEYLKRYPVGAGVFVYYDPKQPGEAVLERELPKGFAFVWIFVAVLAVVCVGGALWFTGIIRG
jgi:hypothetical protein